MKSNASTATQTAPAESNWIQQLWQRIAAPIGESSSGEPETRSKRDTKTSTRSPELAPPAAVIAPQTLKAFSDYAEEYEPAHIALIDLIPDELSLLNIPPAQTKASATEPSLIETANTLSNTEEFDCDDDEEFLSALIPSEDLADLSEDVEKTLPDLSAF